MGRCWWTLGTVAFGLHYIAFLHIRAFWTDLFFSLTYLLPFNVLNLKHLFLRYVALSLLFFPHLLTHDYLLRCGIYSR